MTILIACCLVVSDSEPEETNFKQHVTKATLSDETSANKTPIASRLMNPKVPLFAFCQEIESVIFHESTAGLNSYFKVL